MKTKIIAISNQKGGSGKTTLTIHLSTGLSRLKKQVLLIDADPQKTAYRWASSKFFKFITVALEDRKLPELIEKNYGKYNFILIDCPPSAESKITYGALLMADLVIVPLVCSPPDLWASIAIRNSIDKAIITNKGLKSCIFLNKFQPKLTVTKKVLEMVPKFGIHLLESKFSQKISFVESAAQGMTVFELKDRIASEQVKLLTEEVLSLLV